MESQVLRAGWRNEKKRRHPRTMKEIQKERKRRELVTFGACRETFGVKIKNAPARCPSIVRGGGGGGTSELQNKKKNPNPKLSSLVLDRKGIRRFFLFESSWS